MLLLLLSLVFIKRQAPLAEDLLSAPASQA